MLLKTSPSSVPSSAPTILPPSTSPLLTPGGSSSNNNIFSTSNGNQQLLLVIVVCVLFPLILVGCKIGNVTYGIIVMCGRKIYIFIFGGSFKKCQKPSNILLCTIYKQYFRILCDINKQYLRIEESQNKADLQRYQ